MMGVILVRVGLGIAGLVGLLAVAVGGLLGVGRGRFQETYDLAVPPLSIPEDEAALARGEQLAQGITHCGYCHGPDLAGTVVIDAPGRQGVIVAPNLTAGVGGIGATYNTADWVRAIRHGVNSDGRSVIIMPSLFFNALSEDDLAAVVAYMQSLPPIDNELPETSPGPMFYALIGAGPLAEGMSARVVDHAAPFPDAPAEGPAAEYGAYLAELGQCRACHGEQLAGGQVSQNSPIGPNLTPGGELGQWTKEEFADTIRTGQRPDGRPLTRFMPWPFFSRLTDTETAALWAYLQSQPALETQVSAE